MNIWTGHEWNQIQELLLHSNYNTGTVKDFVYCGAEKTDPIPDFIKMKEPALWEYDTGKKNEWKRTGEMKDQDCILSKKSSQTKVSKSTNAVATLQRTKTAGQWQIISAKQIQTGLRRGNAIYLALVLPKSVQRKE